jgi:hypothetical protein
MQFQCKQVILRDIVNIGDESGLERNYLMQTRSPGSHSGPMCVKNSKRPVQKNLPFPRQVDHFARGNSIARRKNH